MNPEIAAFAAIGLMAMVIYGTRAGGAALMSFFRLTPRLEVFLKSLAISVLAAIVASALARGGLRDAAAVAMAALVLLLCRNQIAAIAAGVALAAGLFWLGA